MGSLEGEGEPVHTFKWVTVGIKSLWYLDFTEHIEKNEVTVLF